MDSRSSRSETAIPVDDDVCWICLEASSKEQPLDSPCPCPRKVHVKQRGFNFKTVVRCIVSVLLDGSFNKQVNQKNKFCYHKLPDWRPPMTPLCLKDDLYSAKPTMMVTFRKKVCYVPVSPGPNGLKEFTKYIREKFGLKEDANINVSFGCREPITGSYLKLEGHGAFDAAVHCASISAASRERQKHGFPPIKNARYYNPDNPQLS